jgi:N-acetylglucosaminyldiphosphoundecaprenol N-acetyl-beta-D-mannosaminyltransferase
MDEIISKLDAKLLVGVGAAFDIHTGRIKDAPYWMKFAGVQWLHRIYQDPSRLWRRYCINNPRFLYHLTLEFLGLAKYEDGALKQPSASNL